MPGAPRELIVPGGINAGAPFTIGQIPFITDNDPPTVADSILRQVTVGAVTALIVGATDPASAATEAFRTQGGFISQMPTFGGSLILGQGATVNSSDNIAIGHSASAASTGSVAIGGSAAVTGNTSTGVGFGVVVNGGGGAGSASAFGNSAQATNTQATALGANAVASGIASLACGQGATANATGGIAIGSGSTVNGFAAISIGFNAPPRAANQVLIVAGGNTPTIGAGATGGMILIAGGTVNISHADNIAIGVNSVSFAANTAMIGASGTVINTLVVGAGNTSTTQKALTIRLTDRTGAGNLAGSTLTIRSGAGVGNDLTAGNIALQTPASAAGGTTQGFVTRVTVLAGGGVTIEAPDTAGAGVASLRFNGLTNGAGAAAGTLGNAPTAGDPVFWLPVNIAGTVRYVPCWP